MLISSLNSEHVGLVAATEPGRKINLFCAVGSSTQAFRHSFAVQTMRLELASIPCGGTVNPSIYQGGAV